MSAYFAVHRRAIRAARGAHYCAAVDPLHHFLKLSPLDHRFLQLFIKLIFQCKVAFPIASLDPLFCRHSTHAYTTRGAFANNLSLSQYNTACRDRSLSSRIALLWNALPFEMKSCNTSSAFNAHLACLLNDGPQCTRLERLLFENVLNESCRFILLDLVLFSNVMLPYLLSFYFLSTCVLERLRCTLFLT